MSFNDCSAVLLDIEGTTTPVDFVYEVLFPYARERLASFVGPLSSTDEDLQQLRRELLSEPSRPQFDDVQYLEWLMDSDRKSTALKAIQGRIWEKGYEEGTLQGVVYPDVPPALQRWTAEGKKIAIFSSGSVLAQKLIFGKSDHGDLTRFISGYFDTTTGPKRESHSYIKIAGALAFEPTDIAFVSDMEPELEAAEEAGMLAVLSVRPGNAPTRWAGARVESFSELG